MANPSSIIAPPFVLTDLQKLRTKLSKKRETMIGDIQDIDKAIALLKAGKDSQVHQFLFELDTAIQEQYTVKLYTWVNYE